jgi:hypothetical protein
MKRMLLLADTAIRWAAAAAAACSHQRHQDQQEARGPASGCLSTTSPAQQLNMFDQWFRNQAELVCVPYICSAASNVAGGLTGMLQQQAALNSVQCAAVQQALRWHLGVSHVVCSVCERKLCVCACLVQPALM